MDTSSTRPLGCTCPLGITPARWAELPAAARTALMRSEIYRVVGSAFVHPGPGVLAEVRRTIGAVRGNADDIPSHAPTLAALGRLQQCRTEADAQRAVEHGTSLEYDAIFGHTISADCPPYETQYGAAIIFAQTQCMGDIAAFYRAFGVRISPDAHERADHIAAELEFMSVVVFREALAIIEADPGASAPRSETRTDRRSPAPVDSESDLAGVRDAERKFLMEHLAAWAMSFATRLVHRTRAVVPPDGGFYAALADCLDVLVRDELRFVHVATESIGPIEPAKVEFEPEGCSFACGAAGEPELANLPGFNV